MDKSKFLERPVITYSLRKNFGTVSTNFIKLLIKPGLTSIYLYSIIYDTNVPFDDENIKRQILSKTNPSLRDTFKIYIISGDNLFSTTKIQEELILNSPILNEKNQKSYIIKLKIIKDFNLNLKTVTNTDLFSAQIKHFIEILIKNILHANGLIRIRRCYFDLKIYSNVKGYCKLYK